MHYGQGNGKKVTDFNCHLQAWYDVGNPQIQRETMHHKPEKKGSIDT